MREPMDLDQAEFQAEMATSLYEVIMDKACQECSPQLRHLISLACDINFEIYRALRADGGKHHDQ
ncbi:hypothetical protein [Pantoea dispersa]|uniref:hypothetical protein n=1 Tax=Pantoea dispersa TaxID=59814 RepID=UPI0021F747BA|nr:hypothetical protein [Pantoea dispersa]UYP73336.1 hypothetical protein OF384_18950 [Pantoea dispersa]